MENLLSVKDVAKIVGVTTKTIWTMEKEGRIPKAIRLGKRIVRWNRSEIMVCTGMQEATQCSISK